MSEPEFDQDGDDADSMFDFLAEGEEERRVRVSKNPAPIEKSLPIIRKPVPISESGALRAPKPGTPVESPPPLTANEPRPPGDKSIQFLDDVQRSLPIRAPADDTELNSLDSVAGHNQGQRSLASSMPVAEAVEASLDIDDEFDFGDLDLDRSQPPVRPEPEQTWEYDEEEDYKPRKRWFRWILAVIALLLISLGGAALVNPSLVRFVEQQPIQSAWSSVRELFLPASDQSVDPAIEPNADLATSTQASDSSSTGDVGSQDTAISDPSAVGSTSISPLMQQLQTQLGLLNDLIADGEYDVVAQSLNSMDRTLYGYGAPEFAEIEQRLQRAQSGQVDAEQLEQERSEQQAAEEEAARLEQEQLAEQAARAEAARIYQERLAQQAAEEEAARLEQEQLAEQAARAEATRIEQERLAQQAAEEEAARLEQEQLAEQAARAEAARIEQERLAQQAAQEEAARLEQEQLAAQAARAEAARIEQERLAQQAAEEEAARLEQEQLAAQAARAEAARIEQERLAQQAAQEEAARLEQERRAELAAQAEALRLEQERLATDRRSAEQRAAREREQARAQRLEEARQRAAQTTLAEPGSADSLVVPNTTGQSEARSTPSATRPITDEELQLVYRQFANLQLAIKERDINAVFELTERSGSRIQQFMQLFANSSDIDARIRNVSTRNATGEIIGTLQINSVTRTDGTETQPPPNLQSVRMTSRRQGAGWSAIAW